MIRSTRKCISDNIGFSRYVNDVEVEVGDSVFPTSLSRGEVRLSLDVLEGFVIGANNELLPMQIVSPCLEGVDNGE